MIYDLIIIGAGPAGITAAIYAARKKLKFLVLSKDVGGEVAKSSIIENYTGYQEITGEELTKKFEQHLKEFEFDFKLTEVKKIEKENDIFLVKTGSEEFRSMTLIIATGTKPRQLNVKGEKEFKNRGVTYCATCDAPLFIGKDVAVIGGGNSALEATIQLISIAKKIYLIDIADELIADKVLIEKAKMSPKVEFFSNTKVLSILGNKFVEKIRIDQKGKEKELNVRGVFINIGYIPNTDLVRNLIKLNRKGEIDIDINNQTNISGIFAAGDCTNVPYKQIIIAAGEGAKASLSVGQYLNRLKT